MHHRIIAFWFLLFASLAGADETPGYIAALASYTEDKLLGDKELLRVIAACDPGAIANPFARDKAELDTAKWHAYETLQEWIESGQLDAAQICTWAKKTLAVQGENSRERAQTRKDTQLLWSFPRQTFTMPRGSKLCGLKLDGKLGCWANNYEQRFPEELGQVASLTSYNDNLCMIERNGRLRCLHVESVYAPDARLFSTSEFGSLDASIPKDLGAVRFVSMGTFHICAIKEDYALECWWKGLTREGPSDLGPVRFISIAQDAWFACAVLGDYSLRCWDKSGNVDGHELGPALQVAAGALITCVIKTDRSLGCAGLNPRSEWFKIEIKPDPGTIHSVTVAPYRSGRYRRDHAFCVVKMSGELACFNEEGERTQFAPESNMSGEFQAVSMDEDQVCGLRVNGTVSCEGIESFETLIAPYLPVFQVGES
jgi:hypothetical protein